MINRECQLSLTRQAKLLGISRGTIYYLPKLTAADDLKLMRRIDELHLEFPFAGSRILRDLLNREGHSVGRKRVQTLMRRTALYCKPNTSKRGKGLKVYPYLLRGLTINKPNQEGAMDITYMPMAKGFIYLCALVDWASRKVVSITMETDFCLEALEEALAIHGKPDIFNTDWGSQFTSEAFTSVLKRVDIRISMDGKGCWRDNLFVARVWRSIKYEEVYLRAFASVSEAKSGITGYIELYNTRRPHSKLDRQTSDEFYYDRLFENKQSQSKKWLWICGQNRFAPIAHRLHSSTTKN